MKRRALAISWQALCHVAAMGLCFASSFANNGITVSRAFLSVEAPQCRLFQFQRNEGHAINAINAFAVLEAFSECQPKCDFAHSHFAGIPGADDATKAHAQQPSMPRHSRPPAFPPPL